MFVLCLCVCVFVCVCVCACVQRSSFRPVRSGSNGDPQAVRMNHIPSSSHFPLMKEMFLPQFLLLLFPLAHSHSPSLESNFTGSSKVAPSYLPKSQLHVVWRCQLKAPSPLSRAERMPLCSNREYRFSLGSWKVLFNGTSPEGPHPAC